MAQIQNRIITYFTARDGGVIASMRGYAAGWGQISRRIDETQRMSSRLNNQWRAIGTTFRYAIAGGVVFGTARLATNLRELQRQMGLLQALGNAQNGIFPTTNFPLTDLLAEARQEAVRAATPINEFNEGLVNMFSSIQNIPENRAAEMMREISITAQLAQTDSETASKAIFGMFQTFGMTPNMQNINRMSRALTKLIGEVPGGPEAARQIFQQYPQLAAVMQMGRGNIPQMLGLYMSLLRTGGTPATAGRGLQYLMQTIVHPEEQRERSRTALRSLGITPDFIEQRGGTAALLRLITAMRTRGANVANRDRLEAMTDEQLDALAETAGPIANQMTQLGITGPGARLAAAAIPRIHGIRALMLLATRPEQTISDLQAMDKAWQGYGGAVEDHAKDVQNLLGPQQMAKAAIALQGMQQQVLLALEPLGNLASRGIVRAHEFSEDHPKAARNALIGGAAFMAAIGLRRGLGGIRGMLGRGGQGFVMAQAAQAAMTQGGMGPGLSPQNPLYVTVVGQLFGGGQQRGLTPQAPPGPVTAAGRRPIIPPAVGLASGGLAMAALISQIPGASTGYGTLGRAAKNAEDRPALRNLVKQAFRAAETGNENLLAPYQREALRALTRDDPTRAHQILLKGSAAIDVNVIHPDGTKKTKRVKVPVELWSGGRSPSFRGQPANARSGR